MPTIQFQDEAKTQINFEGNPTPKDIEEAYTAVTSQQQNKEAPPVGGNINFSGNEEDNKDAFSDKQPPQEKVANNQQSSVSNLEFIPQAGVEITRGLVQSGESLANIAQGVTNLAVAPFVPIGVRAPQIFEKASKYLGELEQGLPETDINPVAKFALNMAGGAAIGIGEYKAADMAVRGLGALSTAGRGMMAAKSILSNPVLDEATKASIATSLINTNKGLAAIPTAQKIVEQFLTHPILGEGTKMAMISALNDYGQTNEAKSLITGAGEGFKFGAMVGAGGEVFDRAVELLKDNGKPAMKAWLQGVLGNEEVLAGGKKVRLVDDATNNPGKYSRNVSTETAEEFKSRSADELSALEKQQNQEVVKMKDEFHQSDKDRSEELINLRQQASDSRTDLQDQFNQRVEEIQQKQKEGMFNARENRQITEDEFSTNRKNNVQAIVDSLQENVKKQQTNLQSGVEDMMAEQKATFETIKSNTEKSINRASQRLIRRNPGIGVKLNDMLGNVTKAIQGKTSLGARTIIRDESSAIPKSGEMDDRKKLLDALNKTKKVTGGRISLGGGEKEISADQFRVKSAMIGQEQNSATVAINKILEDCENVAKDNNGQIPLGKLDQARTVIRQLYEQADVKGNRSLKNILDDVYQAFNPITYAESLPEMGVLKALKEKYHNIADVYKPMEGLFYDSKGNPTPDKVLKAFDEGSYIAKRYIEAESHLPPKLRLSTRIQNLIDQTKSYVSESGKTVEATQQALSKELAEFKIGQGKKLYVLNKSYEEQLGALKNERDTAISSKKYEDVKAINQKRVELQQWKATQTKAMREAQETYESKLLEARDQAKEQHDFLRSNELIHGNRVGTKSALKYPQNYTAFHALFSVVSAPLKAAAYIGTAGLLSPKVAFSAYKMSRNIHIPTSVAVPAGILKNMMQHPAVRQQIATHLSTQSKRNR